MPEYNCMQGEELAVAAPARPSGREGVMRWPHHHHRGGGGCWKVLEMPFSTHVLTASRVTYDQFEHCPIRLYEPGLIARLLGVVLVST